MNDFLAPLYIYLIPAGIILCLVVYQLFLKPLFFSPFRKMPGPPLGHPVYGQFMKMNTNEPGTLHMKWTDDYGPAVRFVGPFGLEHFIFVETTALEHILINGGTNYQRGNCLNNVLGVTTGYGLMTTVGSEHKAIRKMISPAFSSPSLLAQNDMYFPPLEGLVKIFHKKIIESPDPEEGTQVSVYDWVSRVAFDTICATAFDYYPDTVHNPHNELAVAYHHIHNLQKDGRNQFLFSTFMSIPGFPALLRTKFAVKLRKCLFVGPLKPFQTLVSAVDSINSMIRPIMEAKLSEASVKDSGDKKDILNLLIRAYLDDDHKMSAQDLMEHTRTFLGSGHETSSSAISWTLWLLANNPECQKRLRDELLPVMESNPRPDYRDLKELPYLHAVIMESLRVLPPVPYTIREAQHDDFINGHHIPKGTQIYIPIRAVNTLTEVWGPDAKEFRPERWFNLPLTYNSKLSFLTFIAGPHGCVGRTMAIMAMKFAIAMLISHFSFEPAYEGQTMRASALITMVAQDDLPLKIKWIGKLPIPV